MEAFRQAQAPGNVAEPTNVDNKVQTFTTANPIPPARPPRFAHPILRSPLWIQSRWYNGASTYRTELKG